jgi:hypothetical protein
VNLELSFSASGLKPLRIVSTRKLERLATKKLFVMHFVHVAKGHLQDSICIAALAAVKDEALGNGPVSSLFQPSRFFRSKIAAAETAIPTNPMIKMIHHGCLKCQIANAQ